MGPTYSWSGVKRGPNFFDLKLSGIIASNALQVFVSSIDFFCFNHNHLYVSQVEYELSHLLQAASNGTWNTGLPEQRIKIKPICC